MDEGADAEAEVGNGKNRGGGLGVDGEGSFGGALKRGGEFEEGAGGAKEGKETHQEGGVHDVFPQVFLLAEEAENEQGGAQISGDEGGFVDGSGEKKGPEAKENIRKGEANGCNRHKFVTSRPSLLGK